MRYAAIVPLLFVTACTTAEKDDAYQIACSSIPTADALFQIYANTGKVKQSVIDGEKRAITAAQAVCNGPRPSDTKTALGAVQLAVTAILQSIAEAKRQAGA